MVWQEESRLIVMTTKEVERGKTKCARYWPDVEMTEEYGNFVVTNSSEESSKDYTLRLFLVKKKDAEESEERQIFHFHFLGWPDHGTPEDPGSVLNFLHDVNLKQETFGKSSEIVLFYNNSHYRLGRTHHSPLFCWYRPDGNLHRH